jgi:uncharacterized protein
MADPQIEKLLIVQNRDASLLKIELELARLPQERASIDGMIKSEQSNLALAQQALKNQELQRKELDSEVKAKESAIARFKTQQLEVKKNEEYKVLAHQIEQSQSEILQLEEQEIELMLEIDCSQESWEQEKILVDQRIQVQRDEIKLLAAREQNLANSVEAARSDLTHARELADPNYLSHYDRVKKLTRRGPYVVPIKSHQCGGCHLRVSNEVSHGVLKAQEPYFCDQCARIVYA